MNKVTVELTEFELHMYFHMFQYCPVCKIPIEWTNASVSMLEHMNHARVPNDTTLEENRPQ
jgi:hypothetical protein